MLKDNLMAEVSKSFALRIISLVRYLLKNNSGDIVLRTMVKQLIRSGTSIGANVHESKNAQSKADFISKLGIALKESDETEYWLILLHESNYLNDKEFDSIINDNRKIIGTLVKIIKKTKEGINKQ